MDTVPPTSNNPFSADRAEHSQLSLRDPEERWPPGYVTSDVIKHTLNITHAEFFFMVRKKYFVRDKKVRGTRGTYLYPEGQMARAAAMIEKWRGTEAKALNAKHASDAERSRTDVPLPSVLSNVATPYTSAQSSEVFKRLNAGQNALDVVVETGIHPAIVQSIARDWDHLRQSFSMPKDVLEAINELDLPRGRITKPQQILRALMHLIAARKCTKCNGSRPCAQACISCVVRTYEARKKKAPSGESAAEGDDEDMTIEDVSGSGGSEHPALQP